GSPALEVIRDLNASFRPILDGGGKPDGRPAPRGLLAWVDGHLELGLVLRRERSSREKAGGDDEEDSCASHGYILEQFADYIQTITQRHPCRTEDDPLHKRWVAYTGMIWRIVRFRGQNGHSVVAAPLMSALGQKQTCASQKAMSALPRIATAKANSRKSHVCFTPESGHVRRTCPCPLRAKSGH